MGLVMTGVLGVVGSFVGGFFMRVIGKGADPGAVVHPAGLFMSLVGALVILFAWTHLVH